MYSEFDDSDSDESSCCSSSDASPPTNSIFLHLDVDYFYAQCEELELPLSKRNQPIAVGQKHIIVTCNYIARSLGIKKLMLQTEAKRTCPSLLIIDGSNLERYRRYSTLIYSTLRQEVHDICRDFGIDTNVVKMKKGGMDEACSDVTALVHHAMVESAKNKDTKLTTLSTNALVYGNNDSSITLREDQSGAQTTVTTTTISTNSYSTFRDDMNDAIEKQLSVAAVLAERARRAIYLKTGFTTSVGISTSPMLSKIASSLQKPNGLSILYPWRALFLLSEMPLRSIPQLGRQTLKALEPCLQQCNKERDFWTCRDLLQVPRHEVIACLETMKMSKQASEALCDDLINKCRGIDTTQIEDDGGGLAKTVSVENSFRRNSVTNADAVMNALQDLVERLPRLLHDRRDNSPCREQAYPTTLRVTVAIVDQRLQGKKKRPFVSKSKQGNFVGGKALMEETFTNKQCEILRKAVVPLVNTLVLNASDVNVVRLNIAVTGFQDLEANAPTPKASSPPWAAFAAKGSNDRAAKRQCTQPKASSSSRKSALLSSFAKSGGSAKSPTAGSRSDVGLASSSVKVDPSVLAELPPDIRAEVARAYNVKGSSKRTIADFFGKK